MSGPLKAECGIFLQNFTKKILSAKNMERAEFFRNLDGIFQIAERFRKKYPHSAF